MTLHDPSARGWLRVRTGDSSTGCAAKAADEQLKRR